MADGPITEPREALELALRSILDADDAVSAAGIVLDEGWRPPAEVAALHKKISDDREERWSMQRHLDHAKARLEEIDRV